MQLLQLPSRGNESTGMEDTNNNNEDELTIGQFVAFVALAIASVTILPVLAMLIIGFFIR